MSSYASLPQFGFMAVTGTDALSFLQGYVTCDLDQLGQDNFLMGATCNIKGRMLTSFIICRINDGILLRMDQALVQTTIDFLKKYIVFSKAKTLDYSAQMTCYGLLDCPGAAGSLHREGEQIAIQVSPERQELWSSTPPTSGQQVDPRNWQLAEIRDGRAWVSTENSEEFIPQMFNYHQLDGIDFSKGCYLGQEIVARMQFRGELKRRLRRFQVGGSLSVGSAIYGENRQVLGTVVTCIASLTAADEQSSEGLAVLNEKQPIIQCFTDDNRIIELLDLPQDLSQDLSQDPA